MLTGGRGCWGDVRGAIDTYENRVDKFMGSEVTGLSLLELICMGLPVYALMYLDETYRK